MTFPLVGSIKRLGGDTPVIPTTDLSWWFRADLDAKVVTANGSVTEFSDNTVNSWLSEDLRTGTEPVHNSAGGYIQFTNGQKALQSEWMQAVGGGGGISDITSGFMMMVVEFDAITSGRWTGGVCSADEPLGSNSGNQYLNFVTYNSGGIKLRMQGRLTNLAGANLTINGITTITTGQKYLLQVYVPDTGGTYFEIDGNAEANDAAGDRFPGILDPTAVGLSRYKCDLGGIQSTSFLSGQSQKLYEFIGYQNWDATAYSEVETYLKTKYGIS